MQENAYEPDDTVVTVIGPVPAAPPALTPEQEPDNPLLGRLLKIADGYRVERGVRQAIEIYFELVEDHPDSPEARKARQRLLRIGEEYEHFGEFRQARSIYERLL